MSSSSMKGGLALILALVFFTAGLSSAEDADAKMEDWEQEGYGVVITNASWVDEWVEMTNLGKSSQDLSGWSLKDEQEHIYVFPEGFSLLPGGLVAVHTGVGNDTETDLYMNMGKPIWNNGGDVATLMDADGTVVSQHPEAEED
ncbi:lamin tail domain-containing protein [Methanotrichaceae archaeon M04Ac]|uniref:Lamin tail domain-containing protein n=1 Tax=Candidatus Methanocrinis alkalitolerans TaxID=3033395 RepID=A0ABT5XFP4_9EURY|nr:lamin tail domain-containing protein [Candidatus Methanocrinis alkalitolerans]MCR3884906.1 lamin tail domain-containing protein [Methanothrix sp.]MDF0593540.1 lamin tail domain-containing protein [Candidatus Methanocrinis alkalitolerans]